MSLLLVTGTGTRAGKTLTTAALAACATGSATVVKLAQVGLPAALVAVTRLSGARDVHEFARYPDALAPHHAARESGLPELTLAEAVRRLVDLDAAHDAAQDVVVAVGTGGLLVPFGDDDRWTLADIAVAVRAPVVVAVRPGPDAVNQLALTLGRLAEDGVPCAGVVVTHWPAQPSVADRALLADVAASGADLAGVLAAGIEDGAGFPERARAALAPVFGGRLDPESLLGLR